MKRPIRMVLMLSPVLVTGCAPTPDKHTVGQLRNTSADLADVRVEQGLDRAMESYRRYLEQTPKTAMTPEAMRRLADLKVEKQFGILGDGKLLEIEAPEPEPERMALNAEAAERPKAAGIADLSESQKDFERRASAQTLIPSSAQGFAVAAPGST